MAVRREQVHELVLQALETEQGGIQIYETAVQCAANDELREEWEKYLEQTRRHQQIMLDLCETLGIDPKEESPGRDVVRHIGKSLVEAMRKAQQAANPEAAQLVACECVVLAETKDHLNWELMEAVSKDAKGETKAALAAAVEEVEDEEDKHLYHTQGWTRELWLDTLGLTAVLPPPEEEKDVSTAIGAARAKQQREELMKDA
jgi:rubrerythrin